jgi:hypothetical protein
MSSGPEQGNFPVRPCSMVCDLLRECISRTQPSSSGTTVTSRSDRKVLGSFDAMSWNGESACVYVSGLGLGLINLSRSDDLTITMVPMARKRVLVGRAIIPTVYELQNAA